MKNVERKQKFLKVRHMQVPSSMLIHSEASTWNAQLTKRHDGNLYEVQ
jgi:hypothetical protein